MEDEKMRSQTIKSRVWLLICNMVLSLVMGASAEASIFTLGTPDVAGNWMGTVSYGVVTATFENNGADTVRLTLDATGLYDAYPNAFISSLWFNYDDSKDSANGSPGLAFSYVDGVAATTTTSWNTTLQRSPYKPDGDGYFDVLFDYPTSGTLLPNATDKTSVYDITKSGLVESDFDFGSSIGGGQTNPNTNQDGCKVVVHVQGLPLVGNYTSAFFQPVVVPEPSTIIIWSLLGAGSWLGMRVYRRGWRVGRQPWSPENRQAIYDIVTHASR